MLRTLVSSLFYFSSIDRRVSDEGQISQLKLQHNKECKGLIVQIRYLKARFTRESLFRGDLTYQKEYLLVLLRQFEKRCFFLCFGCADN